MTATVTIPIPETHHDIVDASQVVTLATIGPDESPQVTALWFLVEDDGTIAVSLNTTRQKTKNLLRRPEATLFFLDPANPYRTIEIRARARIEVDSGYAFADRVGAKYGTDLRAMDQPGETRVVIRFEPVKINTFG